MNYEETLSWLYARLPMFSRQGASAYKADLHNIRALCDALGNPERRFRSIHVAGTNGKGSVSHMLASVFQSAQYKTGLYTSPHLHDFRERFRINGQWIDTDYVVAFTERCMPLVEQVEPSFFELTVAMAFSWFAEQRVDIAVIETGLGGRLDSTNIITPELSVITNIGWDHMQILGDTLPKIASEKAGIIKPGVPVVIGETQPEVADVFEESARRCGSRLVFADQLRAIQEWSWKSGMLEIALTDRHHADLQHYSLDLPGVYQLRNALTVLAATDQMRELGWTLPHASVHAGLAHARRQTGLGGRWEQLHDHPRVIADVAHNPDGIKQLRAQLEWTPYHTLHIVLGMVRDKDVTASLALMPKDARYYFTQASIPRAMPADQLQELASSQGLGGTAYADLPQALQAAVSAAGSDDLVLVCGSVFLVGEIDLDRIHFPA